MNLHDAIEAVRARGGDRTPSGHDEDVRTGSATELLHDPTVLSGLGILGMALLLGLIGLGLARSQDEGEPVRAQAYGAHESLPQDRPGGWTSDGTPGTTSDGGAHATSGGGGGSKGTSVAGPVPGHAGAGRCLVDQDGNLVPLSQTVRRTSGFQWLTMWKTQPCDTRR